MILRLSAAVKRCVDGKGSITWPQLGLYQLAGRGDGLGAVLLTVDVVGMEQERLGKFGFLGIANDRVGIELWGEAGIAALQTAFAAGQLKGHHRVQLLGCPHNSRNHMFYAGVAGHDNDRRRFQDRQDIFGIKQADPAVRRGVSCHRGGGGPEGDLRRMEPMGSPSVDK